MEQIINHMEALREELNKLTGEIDYCNNEKVLIVSQKLDKVICEYMKLKRD